MEYLLQYQDHRNCDQACNKDLYQIARNRSYRCHKVSIKNDLCDIITDNLNNCCHKNGKDQTPLSCMIDRSEAAGASLWP